MKKQGRLVLGLFAVLGLMLALQNARAEAPQEYHWMFTQDNVDRAVDLKIEPVQKTVKHLFRKNKSVEMLHVELSDSSHNPATQGYDLQKDAGSNTWSAIVQNSQNWQLPNLLKKVTYEIDAKNHGVLTLTYRTEEDQTVVMQGLMQPRTPFERHFQLEQYRTDGVNIQHEIAVVTKGKTVISTTVTNMTLLASDGKSSPSESVALADEQIKSYMPTL
jgi:hypothetical protein